jgi:hypothetical protein
LIFKKRSKTQRKDTPAVAQPKPAATPAAAPAPNADTKPEPLPERPPDQAAQRVVVDLRTLQKWYSIAFHEHVVELTTQASAEVAAQLLAQFDGELQCRVDDVDYQWPTGAESLKLEIAYLQQRFESNDAYDEIERVETAIAGMDAELELSFTDDSVPLSRLVQLRTAQNDLKSYLRGLKFNVTKTSAIADRGIADFVEQE